MACNRSNGQNEPEYLPESGMWAKHKDLTEGEEKEGGAADKAPEDDWVAGATRAFLRLKLWFSLWDPCAHPADGSGFIMLNARAHQCV